MQQVAGYLLVSIRETESLCIHATRPGRATTMRSTWIWYSYFAPECIRLHTGMTELFNTRLLLTIDVGLRGAWEPEAAQNHPWA